MASEFALSVFSLLLSLSFKRVTCLLYSYLRDKLSPDEVESMLETNTGLIEILLTAESLQGGKLISSSSKEPKSESTNAKAVVRGESVVAATKPKPSGKSTVSKRKRATKIVVDRRRRRGQRLSSGSSGSEGEEEVGDSSSESSLSILSDPDSGEDIQVMESLSDSSPSEDEQCPQYNNSSIASRQTATTDATSNQATNSDKHRASGRRQIVLAASFNLAPSSKDPPVGVGNSKTSTDTAQAGVVGDDNDQLLKEVYSEAVEWSCVHTACSILAEDSYLIPIKVFTEWLHTYSIVIAATSKQVFQ